MNLANVLKLVHIAAMAVWLAGGLGIAGDVRRTLARGKPHTELLVPRVDRALTIAMIAGLLTIATGLGLVFVVYGGMKGLPIRYHASLGLALVAYALLFTVLKPATARLEEALSKGEGRDLRALSKRIAMLTGIDHLLKIVILVLMVLPIGH